MILQSLLGLKEFLKRLGTTACSEEKLAQMTMAVNCIKEEWVCVPFSCACTHRLSFCFQYNNTFYGISAVNTGRTDISKLEQFTMWRNESLVLPSEEM